MTLPPCTRGLRRLGSLAANEKGSALLMVLMVLAMVTLLGISATNTSLVEIKIAGHEKSFIRNFFVADSGWREGRLWLNAKATPPVKIDSDFVRELDNPPKDLGGVSYAYSVTELDENEPVPGYGKNFSSFAYLVNSDADSGRHQVEVEMRKVYKVGY